MAWGLRRLPGPSGPFPAPGTPQSLPNQLAFFHCPGAPPPRLEASGRGGLECRGGPEGQRAWPRALGSSSGPSSGEHQAHLTSKRMLPSGLAIFLRPPRTLSGPMVGEGSLKSGGRSWRAEGSARGRESPRGQRGPSRLPGPSVNGASGRLSLMDPPILQWILQPPRVPPTLLSNPLLCPQSVPGLPPDWGSA